MGLGNSACPISNLTNVSFHTKVHMSSDSRIYFILMTIVATAFIVFGFYADGLIARCALIVGGLYFGHLLTEALNYDSAQAKERN
jgi:hypothetical protein